MIQYPTTTAPIQQQAPVQTCAVPQMPEFNAIKINISGAQVGAPAQTVYPAQPVIQAPQSLPAPVSAGENIDINA